MLQNNEITLWRQKPSQKKNTWQYVSMVFFGTFLYLLIPANIRYYEVLNISGTSLGLQQILYFLSIICFIRIGYIILVNYTTEYELTSERLIIHSGILTRYSNQLELYRVKDYVMIAPLLYRIFLISKIMVVSMDTSQKIVILDGVYDGESVLKALRDYVEICRDAKKGIFQIF